MPSVMFVCRLQPWQQEGECGWFLMPFWPTAEHFQSQAVRGFHPHSQMVSYKIKPDQQQIEPVEFFPLKSESRCRGGFLAFFSWVIKSIKSSWCLNSLALGAAAFSSLKIDASSHVTSSFVPFEPYTFYLKTPNSPAQAVATNDTDIKWDNSPRDIQD